MPKKHRIISLLTISIVFFSNATFAYYNGNESLKELFEDSRESIESAGRLPDGLKKVYYDNGRLKFKVYCRNDKWDGEYKRYYKNGRLRTEAYFKEDKLNGVCRLFYENGNLKIEINHKNNKLNGIRKDYYENGQLIKKAEEFVEVVGLRGIIPVY